MIEYSGFLEGGRGLAILVNCKLSKLHYFYEMNLEGLPKNET